MSDFDQDLYDAVIRNYRFHQEEYPGSYMEGVRDAADLAAQLSPRIAAERQATVQNERDAIAEIIQDYRRSFSMAGRATGQMFMAPTVNDYHTADTIIGLIQHRVSRAIGGAA